MSANASAGHPLLRHRDGHHARGTFEELLFDLVYVFAVTQLSHGLLHHLTLLGVVETLIMWFAVWLALLTTLVSLIVCFVEWPVVRRFRAKQAGAVIEH